MHINDILQRDSITFSFEFFPPQTDKGWDRLFDRIRDFETLAPSFVSVTYGTDGSTRRHTHELVVKLRQRTGLDAVPHLTCTGHGRATIKEILLQYAGGGVPNVLAIRGDRPEELAQAQQDAGDFTHAVELVRFIRQFNDAGLHPDPRGFGIIAAGFPEGHPETPNRLVQMDHLKAKVDAGVDCLISQMFFDNHAFYDWRDHCRLAGIRIPLLAGIMPITSIANMKRMADLAAGTRFPTPLLKSVYRCQDDPEAVKRVGIHWATEQCRDLIDQGVKGIHFYTLNQSDATREIYRNLGAKDSIALRREPMP
ncbi:MAG: methylenetetrahydrofolate reductase [NAD(P)H] [Phycisphaerales bacterium]|nr:MAG: methylenetetrahydrofolate reductase [NAD(P)H] [Phycisphaerales bacterium]